MGFSPITMSCTGTSPATAGTSHRSATARILPDNIGRYVKLGRTGPQGGKGSNYVTIDNGAPLFATTRAQRLKVIVAMWPKGTSAAVEESVPAGPAPRE
jgi:hypothetical protein